MKWYKRRSLGIIKIEHKNLAINAFKKLFQSIANLFLLDINQILLVYLRKLWSKTLLLWYGNHISFLKSLWTMRWLENEIFWREKHQISLRIWKLKQKEQFEKNFLNYFLPEFLFLHSSLTRMIFVFCRQPSRDFGSDLISEASLNYKLLLGESRCSRLLCWHLLRLSEPVNVSNRKVSNLILFHAELKSLSLWRKKIHHIF